MIDQEELCPILDRSVKIGPPEIRAGKTFFHVKQCRTNHFFRIGEREQFLLAQMDSAQTVTALGDVYRQKYNAELPKQSWDSFLRMLNDRHLIENSEVEQSSQTGSSAPARYQSEGLFVKKFRLANPHGILSSILPSVRPIFLPNVVVPTVLALILAEIWVFFHLHDIYLELSMVPMHGWMGIALTTIPLGYLSILFHEFGHAITCEYFGGQISDMGLIFRYFTIFPYTRLDDALLFHNRLQRVYVLIAGPLCNIALGLPFIGLWLLSDPGSYARSVSGVLIAVLNLGALFNFLPFVQLDGYFILCAALRMPELRKDAYELCMGLFKSLFGFQKSPYSQIAHRDLVILLSYGLASGLITFLFVINALHAWHRRFSLLLGNRWSWVVIGAIFVTLILLKLRRKSADLLLSPEARQIIAARPGSRSDI